MKLLFIDACPRDRAVSRTYDLCRAFLEEAKGTYPDLRLTTIRLGEMDLAPFGGKGVKRRDELIDGQKWEDKLFEQARLFAAADYVLVGAPYWDLSFPALLKIYVENIFVRNLTFRYTREGEPLGLSKGRKAVYITTAGSPINGEDWGAGYMKAVFNMLGIPEFVRVSAEGIDIEGWDVSGIMEKARHEARQAGRSLAD